MIINIEEEVVEPQIKGVFLIIKVKRIKAKMMK